MKFYKIFFLILCLFLLTNASAVLAVKQVPPKLNTLQPLPSNIAPNVSGNVNSQTHQAQQNFNSIEPSNQVDQNSAGHVVAPIIKNNLAIMIVAVIVALLLVCLIFLYFR